MVMACNGQVDMGQQDTRGTNFVGLRGALVGYE